jgi:hypothetical protein
LKSSVFNHEKNYHSGYFLVIAVLVLINIFNTEEEYYNLKLEKLKQEYAINLFLQLTTVCLHNCSVNFPLRRRLPRHVLECHTERHKEVMNSAHWNWERISYIEGRGVAAAGKKNVLNNFCLGLSRMS